MLTNIPPGFRVLSSPAYQCVILDTVSAATLRDLCVGLNCVIESLGYKVEGWSANPLYVVRPGGWVMPAHQVQITKWLGLQPGCKYVRTERDKNPRPDTMMLSIWNEKRACFDLSNLHI